MFRPKSTVNQLLLWPELPPPPLHQPPATPQQTLQRNPPPLPLAPRAAPALLPLIIALAASRQGGSVSLLAPPLVLQCSKAVPILPFPSTLFSSIFLFIYGIPFSVRLCVLFYSDPVHPMPSPRSRLIMIRRRHGILQVASDGISYLTFVTGVFNRTCTMTIE
jgi:hypothetical protein